MTGLTSLADNACSKEHWHKLPCLQYLDIRSAVRLPDLGTIAALTNLRGLALCLGSNAMALTSLVPLTALSLQRLELVDRAVAVPALSTLTRLSIEYRFLQNFPELAALPALSQVHLTPYGPSTLPDLPPQNFPSLTGIFFTEIQGQLLISARLASRYSFKHVQHMPWIDEDT